MNDANWTRVKIIKLTAIGEKKISMVMTDFTVTPSTVTVKKGDKVTITLSAKEGDHGLSIPAFNVSQAINEGKTVTVSFVADKTGSFPFFCNVFCGEGHRDMKGTLIVK